MNGPNSIENRAADEGLGAGAASGTLGVTVGTVEAVGDVAPGALTEPGGFGVGEVVGRAGVGGDVVGGVGLAGVDRPTPRRWRRWSSGRLLPNRPICQAMAASRPPSRTAAITAPKPMRLARPRERPDLGT